MMAEFTNTFRLRLLGKREAPTGQDHSGRPSGNRLHAGITLMEVLISIGVVSLGLLGVAALIPVAQFKAAQGILEDRKAAFGRQAVREFRIRGMNSPRNWVDANGNSIALDQTGKPIATLPGASGTVLRRAYCLDPRMVATNRYSVFPVTGLGGARMPRITLRAIPGQSAPMNQVMADEVFVLDDELVFQIPRDRPELPPLQQYLSTSAGNPIRGYSEGNLSWMATLVPSPDGSGSTSDTYLLSIVIFNKRNLSVAGQAPAEEVVAKVAGSLGPGEITLEDFVGAQLGISDIRVGDWLLLVEQVPVVGGGATPFFRWTRVINATEYEPSQRRRAFSVSLSDIRVGRQLGAKFAVFLDGVVSVYERTVRLEDSTLWN